jgi:mevalonate kinase
MASLKQSFVSQAMLLKLLKSIYFDKGVKMIKVSAPSKIIIAGEHAVVYGKPGIIAAIDKRCYITAEKSDSIEITSNVLDNDISFTVEETKKFADKADKLWKECSITGDFTPLFDKVENSKENILKVGIGKIISELDVGGAKLDIDSEIPMGSGLGSSASLAVSLVKTFSELYGKNVVDEKINDIAFKLEQYAHGTPSGGDNSTCTFGGIIKFQKGKKSETIVVSNLKGFVTVYIKKPEKTTGELVQMVKERDEYTRNKHIEALGSAVEELLPALNDGNSIEIIRIINVVQKNLSELGVSCKEIDEVAEAVRGIGGAAKLCGGGSGGIMLCYHKDIEKLKETIKSLGYIPEDVVLGAEGVRTE